jgi:putative membrane protein
MEKRSAYFILALKGMAMGIAEVIPGVSGGTIAFITGIYERLINAIKVFLSPAPLQVLRKNGLRAFWIHIDGNFLLGLMTGMAAGVIVGVFGVSLLLESYPVLLWAFFFGLIVASAIYIGRQVDRWSVVEVAGLILGTILAFYITIATPAQGNEALWMVFLSGVIAVSALILPGISGSFMLLLMGMYTLIIPAVKEALRTQEPRSLLILLTFAVGCLVGLATFSRLLSWTFRRYRETTLAVLTGFMIGSLNKIWPWRNVIETRLNSRGEEVPFLERSVLPGQYDGEPLVYGAILMIVVGFASVFIIERIGTPAEGKELEEAGELGGE